MPIASMQWAINAGNENERILDRSRDRHVLRSQQGPDLIDDESLIFRLSDGSAGTAKQYFSTGATDVTIDFRPLFAAANGTLHYSGFGIRVEKATGVVTCDPGPLPPDAPSNFLIEVRVTQNAGGTVAAEKIDPLLIRIHLHDSVSKIWLTPDEMTVWRLAATPEEATLFRFTARAEFNDTTSGDITLNHGLLWSSIDPENIRADGFISLVSTDAAGTVIKVKATTPAAWGSLSAEGTARVAVPSLAAFGTPEAELVGGPDASWQTITPAADGNANVLFLGTGFPDEDDKKFATLIAGMCDRLKIDVTTRPYDLLANSFNFWRVRSPAKQRGISIRCEVISGPVNDFIGALPLEGIRRPPRGSGTWDFRHLMFAAGLPCPSDKGTSVKDLRARFVKRAFPDFALAISDDKVVTDKVIESWLLRSNRTFVDEVDSPIPLSVGVPPSATSGDDIDLHADRGGAAILAAYLAIIVAKNGMVVSGGGPLGTVWTEDRPSFAVDNRSLLICLGAIAVGRANLSNRVNLVLEPKTAVRVIKRPGFNTLQLDIRQNELPFQNFVPLWRVVAHELAHSLFIADEYVEQPNRFPALSDVAGTVFDAVPNLTSLAAVMDPAPVAGGKEPAESDKVPISGDKTKWRWPRIRTAAVISAPLSQAGGDFVIPVVSPQSLQFTPGMKIRLRSRTRRTPLKRFDPQVDVSRVAFTVGAIDPGGASITITPIIDPSATIGAETFATLSRFIPGSLIFEFVEPPVSAPRALYPYAELLTYDVRQWMNTEHAPLTPWPCDPEMEFERRALAQIPVNATITDLLFSRRNYPRTVGLYSGGGGFACGVFHPTGLCMMRNHESMDEFCSVCRYILVDLLDPTQHQWIERDLANRGFE